MRGISRSSNRGFIVVLLVLTITFCLVSAGIFKANTSISMAAYAKKSKESSGGDKNNDGGGSKGGGDSSSGGSDGGDKGGDSSSGSSTRGDNDLKTEEPNPPPPTIEEPPPTVEQPSPPPPPICEQGSTSPECSSSTGPTPPPPTGLIDCSTNSNDPSCKTTPGPVDCNINPTDPSCKPPVDCKTNPDDPSCNQPPPPVDCKANPNDASCIQPVDCNKTPNDPSCKPDCTKSPDDPSCKVDCTTNPSDSSCPTPCQPAVIGISCPPPPPECKSDEHLDNGKCVKNGPGPDDDCLFNPSLSKCKATCDENNNCQCPEGFSMNEDDHCFPDKPCPKGYERHNEDESGKCFPITCPPDQQFDPKVNKCVPICPDGTELLNGKCPTKTLSLSISIAKKTIERGSTQIITFRVSDNGHPPKDIGGARIDGGIKYVTEHSEPISGTTDGNGLYKKSWQIGGNSKPGIFKVSATASKDGYNPAPGSDSFKVTPATTPPHDGGGGGGGGGHNQVAIPAAVQQVKYFKESTDMPPNSPLFITNTSMHKDTLNDIIITGEIKNRGTNTANFVELISTFYNINNQTVGNENTFTKPSTLQPGQAAPFTMYLSPKDMPLAQIKSAKYHLSWKYSVSSTSSPSPSPASKTLLPNTSR
jgi:hypothetical protein